MFVCSSWWRSDFNALSKVVAGTIFEPKIPRVYFSWLFESDVWICCGLHWFLDREMSSVTSLTPVLRSPFSVYLLSYCCVSGNLRSSMSIAGSGRQRLLSSNDKIEGSPYRRLCVHSLFGGKKDNSEKGDDAPSKVVHYN